MGKKLVNKVLLIGWDAADWKVINPLIQQGKMPALKKLMDEGVHGRIKTLDPPLSPMLWTSIATGVRADRHGIKGFIEPTPDGQGLRPVTSTSRKVKAIWNILNQENYKSNVVAWWPSNPAEPINGVMVSNFFQGANKKLSQDWDMPNGTVHPAEMTKVLKEFRVHPAEMTSSMLLPFVPNLRTNKELREDKRVFGISKTLAHAASVHAASTYLIRETEWDFMAVYHDAIDHFSHISMKYYPPRRSHIEEKDYENFNGVVEAGYRFHDMMLERTLDLIDDQTTVVLLSDHGFHCDHLRPLAIPKEPSGPAVEHNPYGIIVMKGPGIKQGEVISGASVIDVTPTLLTLFGLPVGKDMEGKVLTTCFSEAVEPEYIESWEKVEGNDGMHDADIKEDPWAAQEAMQQLVELGYIDALDDNKLDQIEKAKLESRYYVARNMINGGRVQEGIAELKEIFENSKITRYGKRLAAGYLQVGEYSKCETLVEQLKIIEKENFKLLKKEKLEKNPNDPFGDKGMEEPMYLEYIEGLLHLSKNRLNKALPILEKVQARNNANLGVCLNIGKIHLSRKNYVSASEQYIKALAIDEQNPGAHHGLGLSFLRRDMPDEAIEEFHSALDLNFYHTLSHYHLGEAYIQKKEYELAAQAFNMAVHLSPGMTKAHQWLANIYRDHLKNDKKALEHEVFIRENIVDQVVVVSGLPGSGASKIIEMLREGGLEIYDNNAISGKKDLSIEEDAKKLILNPNWLDEAAGKGLEIKSVLLNYLPTKFSYKIILVERELNDVIDANLKEKGKTLKKDVLPMRLFNELQTGLKKIRIWAASQPQVDLLTLNYDDILNKPKESAEKIAAFINRGLDSERMSEIIENQNC